MKKKIIVIIGPTASGKTSLAVKLANIFNGEIVSADSRQVYVGMDIGTGKDLINYQLSIINDQSKRVELINIPYHLIDVVSPKEVFSLAKYQQLAYKSIDDILKRGKLPIVVGGSGLYLQSIVDGYNLSKEKPNKKIRDRLESKSVNELLGELNKIDPNIANTLNQSDIKNKRRLIRCIEINSQGLIKKTALKSKKLKYQSLIINLKTHKEVLHKKIYKRLVERLEKEGMIDEVKKLYAQGVTWKRLEDFGLEYKYIALYLQGKLSYDEMVDQLFIAIRQFAKRQMTWFRRWEKEHSMVRLIK